MNKDKETVSINIQGGLGNQLFQIATTIAYSKKYNKQVVFPNFTKLYNQWNENRHTYWNTLFNNFFALDDYNRIRMKSNIYKENGFQYKELPFIKGDVLLEGYFQSYKYVDSAKDAIKYLLWQNTSIKNKVDQLYNDIIQKYKTEEIISCHFRRGDYLQISHIHTNLDLDYYIAALSFFSSTCPVIIFSNDIEWCKQHLGKIIKNPLYFVENKEDYIELLLMSKIKNNIIANSSFSWWASYLNDHSDKKIIATSEWFAPNSILNFSDIYFPNIIKI